MTEWFDINHIISDPNKAEGPGFVSIAETPHIQKLYTRIQIVECKSMKGKQRNFNKNAGEENFNKNPVRHQRGGLGDPSWTQRGS